MLRALAAKDNRKNLWEALCGIVDCRLTIEETMNDE